MDMWAGSAAVGMTREPALTDEALASTTSFDADPRIVIGVLSVIGIRRRHDRTVAVRSPRRTDLGTTELHSPRQIRARRRAHYAACPDIPATTEQLP